jgi:hypothetical protein
MESEERVIIIDLPWSEDRLLLMCYCVARLENLTHLFRSHAHALLDHSRPAFDTEGARRCLSV